MDEKVVEVPAPLPVDKEEKKALLVKTSFSKNSMSRRVPLLLSVQEVLEWTFIAAGAMACAAGIGVGLDLANVPIPCSESSRMFPLPCPGRTPNQEAQVDSLVQWILLLTVPHAAAATVGLLLPHRHARSRWSLAFLAILFAAVAHYMNARMVFVVIASNPGRNILSVILGGGGVVVNLLADLLCILSLIGGGAE